MKKTSTGRDVQRASFVSSLYNSLKKKTAKAIDQHEKMIALATSYSDDGLSDLDSIELLMIDGDITREAAESYIDMIKKTSSDVEGMDEYFFQFEDSKGNVVSSFDIGRTVLASCEDDARVKAEESVRDIDDDVEIINVSKIS